MLRGRLLDMVGALWLSQVATATPKCLYGGLATSLPTPSLPAPSLPAPSLPFPPTHPHALLALY